MAEDDEKKAKVLHTRVPESLERELKDKANSLGLSVSTLVRNILGNAFDLVEDIVTDSAAIARSARSSRGDRGRGLYEQGPPAAPAEATSVEPVPGRVLGWQESILNLNAVCDRCNTVLHKGSRAAIAVVEGAGKRPVICLNCLMELLDANDADDDAAESERRRDDEPNATGRSGASDE